MGRIETFLTQRQADGLLRVLRPADLRQNGKLYRDNREFFDFSSNDYLGLSEHPQLKIAATKAIEKYGTGSCASRLLNGNFNIHHELEEKTASFKDKESALVYNCGYQANVGIISAICNSSDAVFCDKLSHASILDGISLSGARMFRFRHNDIEHLESLLKKSSGKFENRLIITESIFSMDGDRAPLKEIVSLKEKYDCKIMVDEAHATGVFGKTGSGVVGEEGLNEKVDFVMGTFSKALGSFGAYLACAKKMKEYLINTSRSFIYSTALPPSVIAANIAALEVVRKESFRRETLLENAAYFRSELEKKGFQSASESQIVPLVISDASKTVKMSNTLGQNGYIVGAIRPPTVPEGQSRLRISLTYYHNKEILNSFIEKISDAANV
ncbi:MAG: 8-amino-7-oxononanoate synthase [Phycisphaerae bacterium]|nr:8-amino-7-oxononanoate synthase [Phycisphaerae bacterium]